MDRETCITYLRVNKLKVTPKRLAVIDLLLAEKKYFSPYQVRDVLIKADNPVGLPTVYRILQEFTAIGLVTEVEREDRQQYYFLCDESRETHHHHFICRACHRVESVRMCFFDSIKKQVEKQLNAQVQSHVFQLEGLCAKCKKQ